MSHVLFRRQMRCYCWYICYVVKLIWHHEKYPLISLAPHTKTFDLNHTALNNGSIRVYYVFCWCRVGFHFFTGIFGLPSSFNEIVKFVAVNEANFLGFSFRYGSKYLLSHSLLFLIYTLSLGPTTGSYYNSYFMRRQILSKRELHILLVRGSWLIDVVEERKHVKDFHS